MSDVRRGPLPGGVPHDQAADDSVPADAAFGPERATAGEWTGAFERPPERAVTDRAVADRAVADRAVADERRDPRGPPRLGQLLREGRERAGLDLSDVAEVTHVRRSYLAALEEGRYGELPEDVYTRNFLRLYAQALRLESDPLLELYRRERRVAMGLTTLEQRLERDRTRIQRAPEAAFPTAARRRASSPAWLVGPLLPTVVLVGLVVGIGLWGFNQLFTRPSAPAAPTATSDAAPADAAAAAAPATVAEEAAAAPGADAAPPGEAGAGDAVAQTQAPAPETGLAAPSLAGPGQAAALAQVRVDVVTVPPGASITIDGFPIPGRTPLSAIPVTGRDGRVVRAELDGFQSAEVVADLSRDTRVDLTLAPLAAPGAPADEAAPPATAGRIQITVTDVSWLEVYSSTERNVGERLVYLTAQPGSSYSFEPPIYVYVGNAAGVRVAIDGQDVGAMGSPGAVLGRAFP